MPDVAIMSNGFDVTPSSLKSSPETGPSAADLETCLRILRQLEADPSLVDAIPDLRIAVSRSYNKVRRHRRRAAGEAIRAEDRAKIEATGRCVAEPIQGQVPLLAVPAESDSPVLPSADPSPAVLAVVELSKSRSCYVCKGDYRQLDRFYHLLCPDCATENHDRRAARAEMNGRRAVVTGGRIKIGYQTALKLLRDGAEVWVTSRFPRDAARRYAAEPDFADWSGRLRVYGLDLRDVRAAYAFADHLAGTLDGLDVLINNAAQTIRREPDFYRTMYERESEAAVALTAAAASVLAEVPMSPAAALLFAASDGPALVGGSAHGTGPTTDLIAATRALPAATPESVAESALAAEPHWPDDVAYDAAGRPRDPRAVNSWILETADVPPAEMAEVMLVNAMSPFALCSRLEPLMRRSRFPDRYVVNVSAMEGNFNRGTKTSRHPHTNMAKAALNMLTRTTAVRLAGLGIYMNSVDTGWVTEENPHPRRTRNRAGGFVPPLDEIDGAARVYDPVVRGVRDRERVYGQFLKDYRPSVW